MFSEHLLPSLPNTFNSQYMSHILSQTWPGYFKMSLLCHIVGTCHTNFDLHFSLDIKIAQNMYLKYVIMPRYYLTLNYDKAVFLCGRSNLNRDNTLVYQHVGICRDEDVKFHWPLTIYMWM